jgi:arylsulfatase A-like enzyme
MEEFMKRINNVVLIIFDSLREDCIEGIGVPPWGEVRTPNLKSFLQESFLLSKCYPESLPTLPARRAIYTGQRVYPFTEGLIREKGDLACAVGWKSLSEYRKTISEILQENGFTTALISDVQHMFKPSKNFHRGFDEWVWIRGYEVDNYRSGPRPSQEEIDYWFPRELQTDIRVEFLKKCLMNRCDIRKEEDYFVAKVMREAVRWLEQNSGESRKFLLIESWSPHEPWFVPDHYRRMYIEDGVHQQVLSLYRTVDDVPEEVVRSTQANYSGMVTLCDAWFGYLLEALKRLNMLEDTLIMITTDHGHQLGDRNYLGKRGYPSYPEVFDIPVIIRHPAGILPRGGKSNMLVQHTDIMPTILDILDIRPLGGDFYKWDEFNVYDVSQIISPEEESRIKLHGKSLLQEMQSEAHEFRDHVTVAWNATVTVITKKWWLNCKVNRQGSFLYDLESEDAFENNVADRYPDVVRSLFNLAVEDAGGKFPDFLIELADKQNDAPGCSELAARK